MKRINFIAFAFAFSFSGLSLLFSPQALAMSGPVGLNSLISDAGPGAGQVTLHWARYASNVDNYSIWYGTSPGKYQYAAANIGNTVVYTIGYLQPGVRYYFKIQGFAQGNPLPVVTPEISEVAPSGPSTVVASQGPFGHRQLVAVTGPASGQVTITWRSVLSDTTNFSVVYGVKPGAYIYGALNIAPGVTPGQVRNFTISSLSPGTRYYFAVVPMRSGEGIYASGEVSQVAK